MFRRRIFYNAGTGEVILQYVVSGNIKANYSATDEALERGFVDWGVLEWAEPDSEVEASFSGVDIYGEPRAVLVSVDISQTPHQLVFTYEPIVNEDHSGMPTYSEQSEALAILGVTV